MQNKVQSEIFMKNLQGLFKQDEILAAKLFGMTKQDKYDVFMGKDPIDINIIDKKTYEYIYEKPAQDTQTMLENLEKEYKRYPIMFFYGLGNGVLHKALLFNKTHQKVVVVEPEIEIIYIVLNLIDLSEELASERLVLFYSDFATYTQFYFLIAKKEIKPFAKIYDLHVLTPFYDKFSEDCEKINRYFTRAISQMVVSHGNSIDDVLIGVRHHIENIPSMVENYSYRDLVKKRMNKMDTAIIVATGPSLDKQLETLKKFVPYATIICLDASYPILAKHGIVPDYVTSVERVRATSTFFKDRHRGFDKDIYFIVASLTHVQTIKNILPRRLVLTMRPQQQELVFDMDDFGYLGLGHSTANQAYQLAYALKHKNIVLIGQDLAFAPDGRSHAQGHAFTQKAEYIEVVAYGGKGKARSTYVWNLFKNQYEKDIEEAKKDGVSTYNCTEGGARIEGSIEKPFLETMQILCKDKVVKNLPNISKVKEERVNRNLLKAYNYISKKLKYEAIIKQRIEEVFLKVTPEIDEILKLRDDGKLSENLFKKLIRITNKIDKVKDLVASLKFKKYIENIITISVYYQELELAKISVAPSDTTMQKVEKLVKWVEVHKFWLFSVAGGLNADMQTTKEASKGLIRKMKRRGISPKDS